MSVYVKKLVTTVKAGAAVELSEKTLIVGPSGSGKSSIANGIELALSGRASDIAGRRTLAADAELWTLAPPVAGAIFARAELSDGRFGEWRLEKGHKSVFTSDVAGAALANPFPLRDVQENLTGSAEKARKWLLAQVGRDTPWTSVLAMIPAAYHEQVGRLANRDVFGLGVALETAKAQAREADGAATTLREQARAQSAGLPPPPTEEEVAQAKLAANTALQRAVEEGEGRLAESRENAKKLASRLEAAEARLGALPEADLAVVSTGEAMLTVLKGQIATGAQKCGICTSAVTPAAARARLDVLQKKIGAAQQVAKARAAAATEVEQLRAALRSTETITAAAVDEVARMRALLQLAPEPPEIAARRASWQAVTEMEARATAKERDALAWRELSGVLGGVVKRVVDGARMNFEARVQQFLPATDTFGLDLSDGDRDVVRFGLRSKYEQRGADGGVETHSFLRSALSGAEWARVTAAIAAAVTPRDAIAVIIPEDRPMDPQTLAAVLGAFGNVPAQVIVCSPILPPAMPGGWTVIQTGAGGTVKRPIVGTAADPMAVPARRRPGQRRRPMQVVQPAGGGAAPAEGEASLPAPQRMTPSRATQLLFGDDAPVEAAPPADPAPSKPEPANPPKAPSIFD